MSSLGEDLKRERELRAVSIKEIAAATKINPRFLEALEADRWDDLQGSFMIKGVIRAFCRTIGADENAFLNKYHQEVLLRTANEERESKRPSIRRRDKPAAPRSRPRVRWILAGLLILAAAAAAFFFLVLNRPPNASPPAIARPASFQTHPVSPPSVPESLLVKPPAVKETPQSPLSLEFTFHADTWIHVTADGQLVLEAVKKAGEKAAFTAAAEFLLQVGNAGGFDWTINGRRARPLGTSGAVRTDVRIDRNTLASYLSEDPAPGPARSDL